MDVMLVILWHIWKARNALVFNSVDEDTASVLRGVVKDLNLWACRFGSDKGLICTWALYIQSCLAEL